MLQGVNTITQKCQPNVTPNFFFRGPHFVRRNAVMGAPPPVFSGIIQRSNLGWDYDGQIEITQEQPLPITILQITGLLEIGDA